MIRVFVLIRDKIMELLKQEDPAGNEIRRKRTLKRRVYKSRVGIYLTIANNGD